MGVCASKKAVAPVEDLMPKYCIRGAQVEPAHIALVRASW
jgi:hypothetical protein